MKSDLERQFSKYLANLMTKDERASFENDLASDDELKNEFEEYQIGMVAGNGILYQDLKKKVSQVIAEEDSKNVRPIGSWRNTRKLVILLPAVSAAVLLLFFIAMPNLFISGDIQSTSSDNNPESIEPEEYNSSARGSLGEDINIDLLIKNLEDEMWNDIFTNFDKLSENDKIQPIAKRIKGYAFIGTGDFNSAITTYKDAAISRPESEDELIANWYIGQLYRKKEMCDSTLFYLNQVKNSKIKSNHKSKAKKLLSKVKKAKFCQ